MDDNSHNEHLCRHLITNSLILLLEIEGNEIEMLLGFLILAVLFSFPKAHGYSTSFHKVKVPSQYRRSFILSPSIAISLSFLGAERADALKPKNDALCGTGFFEHIYEYKCTAIGDIEDEGSVKAMSSDEVGLTEGLLGKLGAVLQDTTEESLGKDLASSSDDRSKTNKESLNYKDTK